jgi:hypothetical protein
MCTRLGQPSPVRRSCPGREKSLAILNIRYATLTDVPALYSLIQEMSEYEHLPFSIAEQILAIDGFGVQPRFRAMIAEFDDQPAGRLLLRVILDISVVIIDSEIMGARKLSAFSPKHHFSPNRAKACPASAGPTITATLN